MSSIIEFVRPIERKPSASSQASQSNAGAQKSAIWSWSGANAAKRCQSLVLRSAYECWVLRAVRGIPRLRDIVADQADARSALRTVYLRVGTDFLCVSQDDGLPNQITFDVCGQLLSELPGTVAREIGTYYEMALDKTMPLYLQYASNLRKEYDREMMILPTIGDPQGKTRFAIGYSAPIDHKFVRWKRLSKQSDWNHTSRR